MSEEERITQLAGQLMAEWQATETVSTAIAPEDASAIACGLHAEMDKRTDARAEQAAEQDLKIACYEGCSYCCESLVMVYRGESIAIAEWLAEPEQQNVRDWFLELSFPRWRKVIRDAPEKAEQAQRDGDGKGYASAALDVWQRRILCGFNRAGSCTIYPVRPNACRNSHALNDSQRCQASHAGVPEIIAFEPLQQFRFGVRPLSEAVHVASGGEPGVQIAVCQDVHDLLTAESE